MLSNEYDDHATSSKYRFWTHNKPEGDEGVFNYPTVTVLFMKRR